MLRTHTCGELRLEHKGQKVVLCGWVQTIRNKGHLIWIDLRDRYGVVQLIAEKGRTAHGVFEQFKTLGREYVVRVEGYVVARSSANLELSTGDIEVSPFALEVLSQAARLPFSIEDPGDGGHALRMKYRYLDLRQKVLQANLQFRHQLTRHIRAYLDARQFIEIETPMLIRSTPEGARDFVVPRGEKGKKLYYALPQSPQTLKQLLMIAGMDRYYQIVKCFRNEDLRADRQPEFTQVDCELSFVEQEDVLCLFEGLMQELFAVSKNISLPSFPRMTYAEAMERYGTDKPDLRWGMPFVDLIDLARGSGFRVFDEGEVVLGICLEKGARLTRKQIDGLTGFVKRPEVGMETLVYVKYSDEGEISSGMEKWYDKAMLERWLQRAKATKGDLLLILAGKREATVSALSSLRLEVGKTYCPHLAGGFAPLWVVDFPLLMWNDEKQRYYAAHHPFTAPKQEDHTLLLDRPGEVKAQAYDMVVNGVELAGGSVRIHDKALQMQIFKLLGFTEEDVQEKFGFFLEAFSYGTPVHAGIAIGFDRLCMMLGAGSSIREYIAFPKNNAGRDLMLDAPAELSLQEQRELGIA